MTTHLPEPFQFLKSSGARLVHYKICSTLDSSPKTGSIGAAIDVAQPIFGSPWVPCVVAAPIMRRYQAFGHLFAGAGDDVYRLDRHPVMARHPVTPMTESDVAQHLASQTDKSFGLISVEHLNSDATGRLNQLIESKKEIVVCDAMVHADMTILGDLIWNQGTRFAIGSQGIEYALVSYWRSQGWVNQSDRNGSVGPVDRMLAVSGSVSPTTASQIDWAGEHGFELIPLDASRAALGDRSTESEVIAKALSALEQGLDPLIYSARGPDDPEVARMLATIKAEGVSPDIANSRIGVALGRVLAELIHKTGIRRAVISGGDTSGHASRELDLYAFTALAPTIPGAPLLEAHSENPQLAGLQLALKGGQMGSADYFGWIKRGGGTTQLGGQ